MTNKSWEKWKNHFLKAHEGFKRHIQACRGADQFVRATANPHPTNVLPLTPSLLEYMDIYLDNMINTVTNEKAVLSELVATNTNQEVTIDTQASTIKNLTGQVKIFKEQVNALKKCSRTSSTSSGRRGSGVDYQKGGYCWDHRYRVKKNHNSASCTKHKDSHNKKSTCKDIMGG